MLGLILAATCVVTTLRVMKAKTMFGLATPIDIGFTGLLVWMFHGTLAGMAGAATGGLALAVFLTVGRWLFGYNKVSVKRRKVVHTDVPSPMGTWFRRWWQRLKGKSGGAYAAAMERANT
jgi:hypothetical protein